MGAEPDSTTQNSSGDLVVARPEAVYFYSVDGRGPCFVFEGTIIHHPPPHATYRLLSTITALHTAAYLTIPPEGIRTCLSSKPSQACCSTSCCWCACVHGRKKSSLMALCSFAVCRPEAQPEMAQALSGVCHTKQSARRRSLLHCLAPL